MMVRKTEFNLIDILENFRDEEISELIEMTDGATLTHRCGGDNYLISIDKCDKDAEGAFNSDEVNICVMDMSYKTMQERRFPTSAELLYTSCIEVIQKLRKQK